MNSGLQTHDVPLKEDVIERLQSESTDPLQREQDVGYLCLGLPKAFCLIDDLDPSTLCNRDIVKRSGHWLHISLMYLHLATQQEMLE